MFDIIVAVNSIENYGIGFNGEIPWYDFSDLQHFKMLTMGKDIVMGRKTWDSLKDIKLDGRLPIVITRDHTLLNNTKSTVCYESSLGFSLNYFYENEFCVIGGASIYEMFLKNFNKYLNRIYLTDVRQDSVCDTFFPEFKTILPYKMKRIMKYTLKSGSIVKVYQNPSYWA